MIESKPFGGFIGLLIGFTATMGIIEKGDSSFCQTIVHLAIGLGWGLGFSFLIASFLYLVFSHFPVSRQAKTLSVEVEGPFLRIVRQSYTWQDRKLHFRAIVDYSTIEEFLMRRCGIKALQITTMAGGQQSLIVIPGVRDCDRIRDMLAEIDSLRE